MVQAKESNHASHYNNQQLLWTWFKHKEAQM